MKRMSKLHKRLVIQGILKREAAHEYESSVFREFFGRLRFLTGGDPLVGRGLADDLPVLEMAMGIPWGRNGKGMNAEMAQTLKAMPQLELEEELRRLRELVQVDVRDRLEKEANAYTVREKNWSRKKRRERRWRY